MTVHQLKAVVPLVDVVELKHDAKYVIVVSKATPLSQLRILQGQLQTVLPQATVVCGPDAKLYEIVDK
jgi:hypothetical protein